MMDVNASRRRMTVLAGQAGARERVAAIDAAVERHFKVCGYGNAALEAACDATWAEFREIIERQAGGTLTDDEITFWTLRMQLSASQALGRRLRQMAGLPEVECSSQ